MTHLETTSLLQSQETVLQFDSQCGLAEGICWGPGPIDQDDEGLWFVDIHACKVHFFIPDTDVAICWTLPERVGWLVQSQIGGQWLLGCQPGIARATFHANGSFSFEWEHILFKSGSTMRLNDGKADRLGNIWFGTMDLAESAPLGNLYSYSRNSGLIKHDSLYLVPNGPCINPQDTLLLHTDSARKSIYSFTKDKTSLYDKKLWVTFGEEDGYPDGMAFDAQNRVWVAHWGGSCVSCFTIDGELLERHPIPATQVTNICFGGPNLDRLFISTAAQNLHEEQKSETPYAGGIFELKNPNASGIPAKVAGF